MTRHMFIFPATVALALAASGGTALAAGQTVCIGGPSVAITTPDARGQCKKGFTLTTLATESEVTALRNRVSTLETANTTLTGQVSALETKLSKVSYSDTGLNGLPTLKIDGANLQIVSGSGATDGTVNGLGNLIIGYDEQLQGSVQTGSHNLVLGNDQTFTSFGGLVAGQQNAVSSPFSDVFGYDNFVDGLGSSVTGGARNQANGNHSSVSGGYANTAAGSSSSVTGGYQNGAGGDSSSVSGGQGNDASGNGASLSGGYNDRANGDWSSVSGGFESTAIGVVSSVSGGQFNIASGDYSSILGGNRVTVSDQFGTYPAGP